MSERNNEAAQKGSAYVASFKKLNAMQACLTRTCALGLLFGATIFAHAASSDVVLYASKAPVRKGTWTVIADSTAAGGYAIRNPNFGAPTITAPLANPASNRPA